jgi:hypothetical protein
MRYAFIQLAVQDQIHGLAGTFPEHLVRYLMFGGLFWAR